MEPTTRSPHADRAAAHRSHGNRFVRRATAWATVGALSVTGAFTALAGWSSHVAAHAGTPTSRTPATSAPSQGSSSGTQSTTPDTSGQGLAAPDTTPQLTQQPPVAASGGS
jgi:hypothetical protein